jgi:hypothetical protein
MARHSTPTPPWRLVADTPRRVGGAARGWPGLGRLLADCWGREGPPEVVRLWTAVWGSEDRPLALRIRAVTAADPFLRW